MTNDRKCNPEIMILKTRDLAQLYKFLPSECKVLSSISSVRKTNQMKKNPQATEIMILRNGPYNYHEKKGISKAHLLDLKLKCLCMCSVYLSLPCMCASIWKALLASGYCSWDLGHLLCVSKLNIQVDLNCAYNLNWYKIYKEVRNTGISWISLGAELFIAEPFLYKNTCLIPWE